MLLSKTHEEDGQTLNFLVFFIYLHRPFPRMRNTNLIQEGNCDISDNGDCAHIHTWCR